MARPSLEVEMKFDNLHCHEEGDGIGSSEAYLWAIYFKIDGDSVFLGDDLFLHGNCTLVGTPGSHGNLINHDIDEGEDVPVPAAIGEFQTALTPIPVPQFVRDTFGVDDAGGVVGVALVLMEENWVSDAGAEAGHAALMDSVRQAIDNLIPTLGAGNPDVTEEQIAEIAKNASDAVSDAISDQQGILDKIASFINGDELLGTKVFTFTHDALIADAFHDMVHRFQKFVRLKIRSSRPYSSPTSRFSGGCRAFNLALLPQRRRSSENADTSATQTTAPSLTQPICFDAASLPATRISVPGGRSRSETPLP